MVGLFRWFPVNIFIHSFTRDFTPLPTEDPRLYDLELRDLLNKAESSLDTTVENPLIYRQFLNSLPPNITRALP